MKKVHLIGDQGVSMQGIARVLQSRGVEVSGCDIQAGGHDSSHITKDIDLVLISSAITQSSLGYPEIQAAEKLGVPVKKRAWLLGRLMQEESKIGVAIAGMHGKSTTTAMVGAILTEAGEDPLVLGHETRVGNGRHVVVEADEYDRSFHALVPKIAAILNIESEHLDYYSKGLPEIVRAFREFIKLIPENGTVIINKNDKNAVAVAKSSKAKVKYVSIDKPWPGLRLKIWGKHNLFDATVAAHICHELGVPSKTIQKALSNFKGIGRRMEHKATIGSIDIYDDYAHHPTEIKATLQAAREHFINRRIVVVFEPHQHSRTKLLFDQFIKSFSDADRVAITPIYQVAGRDEEIDPDLQKNLATNISSAEKVDDVLEWLDRNVKDGDVVITMGAGPIYKLGEQWISRYSLKKI